MRSATRSLQSKRCCAWAASRRANFAEVVYASLFMHDRAHLQDITTWYAVGVAEQKADAAKLKDYAAMIFERRKHDRIEKTSAHLGVPKDRIFFVEHHLAHLAAAYYTAPFASETDTVLGLTCDGAGDNLCGDRIDLPQRQARTLGGDRPPCLARQDLFACDFPHGHDAVGA